MPARHSPRCSSAAARGRPPRWRSSSSHRSAASCIVGVAPEPFAFDSLPVIFKEAEIRGSFIYGRADFDTAIELLAEGRIPSAALIDGAVGLESAEQTFQALTAPGNARVKVLLDPALGA